MKTLIIIQARMGSSRLPGKVLLPLGETVVLDYVVKRCRKVVGVAEVIVATSILSQDNAIADWCEQNGVACFRGSEDDVLSRYYKCAAQYSPDYVIRVTSDCPFVDYEMASDLVKMMEREQVDILDVEGELPRGLVVEIVSFSALERMNRIGKEPRHREHVTYYAYEHREQFTRKLYRIKPVLNQPHLRITLDTEEDYAVCESIGAHFRDNLFVASAKVVEFLLKNPDIAALNAHIEQKLVV
ncbi:glycosyltransferase family protein [Paenibacillus qinlingensis]|uniref:Spore coat polysaccharide biosynthesis protein SpsF n=1 Tax=Paenibacillus qinlingensis TaxID=1837343 RepID=A0ABU1P210_9BACL|nr:glycosyltransferase family protein [Paenibacillus qinlingensis]MDR6553579.1 spore coat polysaccharide biosynthesis protein SpsF [Paenibacillus qinlingensis]